MTVPAHDLRSGKGHRDENFPVASWLIARRHRAPILAFYDFVRTADDVADHPTLPPDEKLALLDALEADLDGKGDTNPEAVALRRALAERGLTSRHAKDLLAAFRLDVTKLRYRDWDDLMSYCALSAMPVGRFVLDVHGESRATWLSSDALCAALQVSNHLQDCRKDYLSLGRVYIPLDALAAHGLGVEALGAEKASPALLACLHELSKKTGQLLASSEAFPYLVKDTRLGLEIAAIHRLARRITGRLMARDPLSERVHLNALEAAGVTLAAIAGKLMRPAGRVLTPSAARDR